MAVIVAALSKCSKMLLIIGKFRVPGPFTWKLADTCPEAVTASSVVLYSCFNTHNCSFYTAEVKLPSFLLLNSMRI